MNVIIKDVDKTDKIELKVPVDIYSRVVGYFQPIRQWNAGKKAEFKDRKYLKYK